MLAHQSPGTEWSPALVVAAVLITVVIVAAATTGHRALAVVIVVVTAFAVVRLQGASHVDVASSPQTVCRNPAPMDSDARAFRLPTLPAGYRLVRTSELPAPLGGRTCWVQHVRIGPDTPTPTTAALYSFSGAGGPPPEVLVGPGATATMIGSRPGWMRTGHDPQTGTLIGSVAWSEGDVDILLRTTRANPELTRRLAGSVVLKQIAGADGDVATVNDVAATVVFEGHPADLPTEGLTKTMVLYAQRGSVSQKSASEVVAENTQQLTVQTWRGQALDAMSLVAGQGARMVEIRGRPGQVFTTEVAGAGGRPGGPTRRTVLVLPFEDGRLAVLDGDGFTPDQLATLAEELTLQ